MSVEADKEFEQSLGEFVETQKEVLLGNRNITDRLFYIDFKDIQLFDTELAFWVLTNLEVAKKALENAVNDNLNDQPINPRQRYGVILVNLSKTLEKEIKDIRADDINKAIAIRGTITQVGEMFNKQYWIKYECQNCFHTMQIYSTEGMPTRPKFCKNCQAKITLKEKDIVFSDYQKIIVEEDTKSEVTHNIMVLLPDTLCKPSLAHIIRPNRKVEVSGTIKTKLNKDKESFNRYLLAQSISLVEDSLTNYAYTAEDVLAFQDMTKSPTLYQDLAQSIIPTISGLEKIKLACLLQLFGGVPLYKNNRLEERGVIHLLMVSSPGLGKSKIMDKVIQFLPNANMAAGKTASGVGLVASVVKDEELGFSVSAGKIALATGSLSCIDELDKVSKEDLAYLNTAMVNMKVNIDKGGLHVTLDTETAILASANPKNRVFDDYDAKFKQIGIPPDILDRFDLIFPLEAPADAEEKKKVITMMLNKYTEDSPLTQPIYPFEFVVKYINYARNNIKPQMTDEVQEYLCTRYTDFAQPESMDKGVYFSYRLLNNIIRLAQAAAKARLAAEISIEDAKLAFDLLIESLKSQDAITEAGRMNYEKVENIPSKGKRDRIHIILGIVRELCKTSPDQLASLFDMIKKAEEQGITEDELEELIEPLKRENGLMESRPNRFRVQ